MFSKKVAVKAGKDATLIAENTKVVGNVTFADQLYVNGHIEGDVRADDATGATLVVSEVGSVKGQVHAPFVVVNGRVEGDVHAGTRVELAANARIKGNVYYKLIEMQLGAMVDGQLVHVREETTKTNIHALAQAEKQRKEG
ncbi:MAG: polymer-forming cytoskeletal protein [Gammaproteobacteria bacterium]|nr:polymer-forming cytoskeletal protein [Gammaproteobacteria bacterium]